MFAYIFYQLKIKKTKIPFHPSFLIWQTIDFNFSCFNNINLEVDKNIFKDWQVCKTIHIDESFSILCLLSLRSNGETTAYCLHLMKLKWHTNPHFPQISLPDNYLMVTVTPNQRPDKYVNYCFFFLQIATDSILTKPPTVDLQNDILQNWLNIKEYFLHDFLVDDMKTFRIKYIETLKA